MQTRDGTYLYLVVFVPALCNRVFRVPETHFVPCTATWMLRDKEQEQKAPEDVGQGSLVVSE